MAKPNRLSPGEIDRMRRLSEGVRAQEAAGISLKDQAAAARVTQPADLFAPIRGSDFVSRDIPHPRWAVEGIWPEGAQGVLGGRPKDGKSSVGAELAVSLATGTAFLNLDRFSVRIPPAPCLYVQVENSEGRVARDLQMIFAARGLGYFEEWEETEVWDAIVDLNVPEDEIETVEAQGIIKHSEFVPVSPSIDYLHILSGVPLVLDDPDHWGWLESYVVTHGIRYLFLDPLYMLTTLDYEQSPSSIRPLLTSFNRLKNEHGCAVILTHHQTSKHDSGSAASRLLGSTYIFGWYEAALFARRGDNWSFSLEVDSTREMGEAATYTLLGRGVGQWHYDENAQGKTDAAGRAAPRVAAKETRISLLESLMAEHPDWDDLSLALELSVTPRTIYNYKKELMIRDIALAAQAKEQQ